MREEDLRLLFQTVNTVGLVVLAVFGWLTHRTAKKTEAGIKSVDVKVTDHIQAENDRIIDAAQSLTPLDPPPPPKEKGP